MQNETQQKQPQAELHNPWDKREAIPSPSLFSVLLSFVEWNGGAMSNMK